MKAPILTFDPNRPRAVQRGRPEAYRGTLSPSVCALVEALRRLESYSPDAVQRVGDHIERLLGAYERPMKGGAR
jgi:hypothetical protein